MRQPRCFVVLFKDLHLWSANSFFNLQWNWPSEYIKPLSVALKRKTIEAVKDSEKMEKLQMVTLHFDGTMEPRPVDSNNLKGKLFLAHEGDVIYSKIDVRNGAIGIVPADMPCIAVTSEFPSYEVDNAVALPHYIKLLFKTEYFQRAINSMISGTSGRKRVQPEQLETIKVPLPPLPIQAAIVQRWTKEQEEIADTKRRISDIEDAIQQRFLADLGLKLPQRQQKIKAFALQWNDVERWGVAYCQQSQTTSPSAGKYTAEKLSDVIKDLENGWSPQCANRPAKDDEWGVLKLGAVSFGTFNDKENKALPPQLTPLPAFEIRNGQVLISRANIPRLVGACAFVEKARPRLMLCDKIFRVVFRDQSPIDPRYLAEVMKIPQVRTQIEASCTGSSPTMQNITKPALLALRIPLPPLTVQREIVARVRLDREKITQERHFTERRAQEIKSEIEAMILGTKTVGSV